MFAPCYWEIPSTDPQATARFLEQLFGWKMSPSADNYWMFEVAGGLGGGIMPVEEPPGQGVGFWFTPSSLRSVSL